MPLDLIISLFLGGLHSGAMLFASLVSVRLFLTLVRKNTHAGVKDDSISIILLVFSYWWPYGRDFMAPLNIITAVAYLVTWYSRGGWENMAGVLCMVFTVTWTVVVMGEDISSLRRRAKKDASSNSVSEETRRFVKSFCLKHHVRTVVSMLSLAYVCHERMLNVAVLS